MLLFTHLYYIINLRVFTDKTETCSLQRITACQLSEVDLDLYNLIASSPRYCAIGASLGHHNYSCNNNRS
jgi:hypothetical protein